MKDVKFEEKAKKLSLSIMRAMNDKELRKIRYENKVKSMNAIRDSDFICYSKLK